MDIRQRLNSLPSNPPKSNDHRQSSFSSSRQPISATSLVSEDSFYSATSNTPTSPPQFAYGDIMQENSRVSAHYDELVYKEADEYYYASHGPDDEDEYGSDDSEWEREKRELVSKVRTLIPIISKILGATLTSIFLRRYSSSIANFFYSMMK